MVYHIHNAAFTHDGEVSANKLYRVVGHEMMHARHKAKGGEWWDWVDMFGLNRATYLSEMYAFQWNMCNLVCPVARGFDFFSCSWLKYKGAFTSRNLLRGRCEW